jgi:hypothetical protein
MMRVINNILKGSLVLGISSIMFSCVKQNDFFSTESGDPNRGQIVKVMEADDVILRARNVAPTLDTFMLIDVRREPSTQAELNSPLTVTLVKNSGYITSYNAANNTSYTELPTANYTLLDNLTVTFQPGEAIKEVRIRLNKTGLDLSQQYALAYTVSQVGSGGKVSTDFKNALVSIIIKNKYDGHYRLTGSMVDAANAALTGYYPVEVDLETVGADAVILNPTQGPWKYQYSYPIYNGAAGSAYGSFTPVFIFDLSTDKIIAVENAYGQPASNGRSGELNPAGENKWFASDRHIEVSYWMNQPSVIPGHRSTMIENFEYLGPR